MTCRDCEKFRWCGLERRGPCTDFKLKDMQDGQSNKHRHSDKEVVTCRKRKNLKKK